MKITAEDLRLRLLPISLGQGVGLVCGVAGVKLGSHLVTPADFGRYGVFVSLTPVGIWAVYTGLNKFVSRHWADTPHRGQLLREVAASAVRKSPWLAALVVLLTLAGGQSHPLLFASMLLVASVSLTLTQLAQTALQAERRHWQDFGFAATGSLLRTFLPLAAYVWLAATAQSLIIGFAVHAAAVALLALVWLSHSWTADQPAAPPVLRPVYDGPLFTLLALVGWSLSGLTRWLAAAFFGAESAGYLTLASNIGAILPAMLGAMLLQFLQPGWFARGKNPAALRILRRENDRAALGYGISVVSLTALLHLFMPYLIGPLVSERYAPAAELILPCGCFVVAIMTGVFFRSLLMAVHLERVCGPADLAGAAVLTTGALAGAWLGWEWFLRWMVVSPLVPWLVNRPLAHRAMLKAAAARAPEADR